ncbi:hypothetical protein LTR37_011550 [Vermiconidia calcicola]|uniref:Uncharacterized protein n=1 Tax=Vermiconidia calcicola TaxID=1690605 RepID=A0ACC3N4G5_9PEZI|nr:hypothetical protein LTR37_011550 [Vermiconidia calcicola]
MTEWAALRSKTYSSAYSPRRGETRNPFDLSKSPFSIAKTPAQTALAAALSANIVPLAYGTETDISIIGPAMRSGVVGIKPTVGLSSRSGVIPISKHFDTVGPFGRRVHDAAIGLNAIAGKDTADDATLHPARPEGLDYCSYLSDKSILKGARFGLPWKRCWEMVASDDMKVATKVLDAIRRAGAQIVWTEFPSAEDRIAEDESGTGNTLFVKVDAYNGINQYLSKCTNTMIRSLEDVVAYNLENRGTEGAEPGDHPAFPSGQNNLQEIVKTKGVEDHIYASALRHIQQKCREEGIDGALKHPEGDLDALLLCDRKAVGQQIAAQAGKLHMKTKSFPSLTPGSGYPIVSIPIGLDEKGIPVAMSLHQTAWKEGALIKWASAIEDMLAGFQGSRRTPTYRNPMCKKIPVFE